jgi:hypothetical protein
MTVTLKNAYASLDDLREHLGDSGGKLPETLLNRALNAASRAVDNFTGRRFWQDDAPSTRLFEYTGDCYELTLPGDAEISTTTGLSVATWENSGYIANWAVDTDFRLAPYDANTGASQNKAWWVLEGTGTRRFDVRGTLKRFYPIQITARFGWSEIPPEVESATLLKAAQLFKRKDAPFGIAQFGEIAAVRITRQDIDVVELLAPYQRDVAMVA